VPRQRPVSINDVPLWGGSESKATYSITSSAVASGSEGSVRPSAFAVLRLMGQFEFGGLDHGDFIWFLAFQDSAGHVGGASSEIPEIDPAGHKPLGFDKYHIR
jgi:hypothetical protein